MLYGSSGEPKRRQVGKGSKSCKKKIPIILLAAAIAVGGGIAIAARDTSADKSPNTPAAPPVPVAEVITRTIVPMAEFSGYLAAPKTVELRSRVGGAICRIPDDC